MEIDPKYTDTKDIEGAADQTPPATEGPERIRYTLPSGAVAETLKHPKGRHMRMAGRAGMAHPSDPQWQNFCLVAETTLINGQAVTAEDIDEMGLGDVNELSGRLMEISQGKFRASAPSSD